MTNKSMDRDCRRSGWIFYGPKPQDVITSFSDCNNPSTIWQESILSHVLFFMIILAYL